VGTDTLDKQVWFQRAQLITNEEITHNIAKHKDQLERSPVTLPVSAHLSQNLATRSLNMVRISGTNQSGRPFSLDPTQR